MSSVIDSRQAVARNTRDSTRDPFRVAIIGCGPRGTQCLEAICRNLPPELLPRLEVTIFEPCEYPGAGCVYDPRQPHSLRMNFAAQHIDFWRTNGNTTTPVSGSLIGWLAEHYPKFARNDQYVPRAVVGEYLSDCYQTLVAKMSTAKSFSVVPQQVRDVQRTSLGWEVTTPDIKKQFDQVVITTGHEGLRKSASLEAKENACFVFPVDENLSEAVIPPQSTVLVRGFGLTCIDAVLALTEGRGGMFATRQSRTNYVASGNEPAKINLFSRSGRPMLAKPTAAIEQVSDSFWDKFRDQLVASEGSEGINFYRDIWSVVHQAAAELLSHSGEIVSGREVRDWFRGWSRYRMDSVSAIAAIRHSYRVAIGVCPRDIPYAIGEAWRKLYPEIVALISYGGLSETQWPKFDAIASEMERIAFGPPARSVARLLALMDSGLIELSNQDQPGDENCFDWIVDAVIAGPHQTSPSGPIASLIEQGSVEIDGVTGAVKVDPNGEPISASVSGLHLFGRATEGWVVGNDTLSRTLHDHIERWSLSIATVHV